MHLTAQDRALADSVAAASPLEDFWTGRFAPAAMHNAGGGSAMYRQCLKCGGHALEGSLSAHARHCDKQAHKALTLAAFDSLESDARRGRVSQREAVRTAARSAL